MAESKPKPKSARNGDKLEIPFVSDEELASGGADRNKLFSEIAAKGQAVPQQWLLDTLGIARASLASLTSRYNYSVKTVKTTEGVKCYKLSVRPTESE